MEEVMPEFKRTRRLLLWAKTEFWDYLITNANPHVETIIHKEVMPNLKLLMDENELSRKDAFAIIAIYLPLNESKPEETGTTFPNLSIYFEYCNSLHGGAASWTLVFSPEERKKLAMSQVAKPEDLY